MSATVDQATPSPAPEPTELAFFIGQTTYGGYRFALRDTFTCRGDAYHHLGEVDLGQGGILVDEERAHGRRGAHGA